MNDSNRADIILSKSFKFTNELKYLETIFDKNLNDEREIVQYIKKLEFLKLMEKALMHQNLKEKNKMYNIKHNSYEPIIMGYKD